jgi:hypothetical protein
MIFLHKLYHVTHDVYEAASQPDVNVDDFVDVIMSAMDDLKKHIPRCDEAFGKIRASVDLLRGNFSRYHRDMKQAGNPSIIMENFVIDVSSSSGGTSLKVKQQFKKIIGHYRKLAQSRPMDQRAKSLFGEIDRNFAALEKTGGDSEDVEPEEPAAPAASAAPSAPAPVETATPETAGLVIAPLTEEERSAKKLQQERERRSRARARRSAAKSIDAFTEKPPVAGEESDLFHDIARE